MSAIPSTAIEIAAAVRSGSLSAREVLDDHLARIDARDGEINAFNLVMVDEALQLRLTRRGLLARTLAHSLACLSR